jgi:hypothetical protein
MRKINRKAILLTNICIGPYTCPPANLDIMNAANVRSSLESSLKYMSFEKQREDCWEILASFWCGQPRPWKLGPASVRSKQIGQQTIRDRIPRKARHTA